MTIRSRFKEVKNIRKWTFAIHLLFGLFLAAIPPAFIYLSRILLVNPIAMFAIGIVLSLAVLGYFAWDEWWDDWCQGTREGESDWWTAFAALVVGLVAFTIIILVHGLVTGIGFW